MTSENLESKPLILQMMKTAQKDNDLPKVKEFVFYEVSRGTCCHQASSLPYFAMHPHGERGDSAVEGDLIRAHGISLPSPRETLNSPLSRLSTENSLSLVGRG